MKLFLLLLVSLYAAPITDCYLSATDDSKTICAPKTEAFPTADTECPTGGVGCDLITNICVGGASNSSAAISLCAPDRFNATS